VRDIKLARKIIRQVSESEGIKLDALITCECCGQTRDDIRWLVFDLLDSNVLTLTSDRLLVKGSVNIR
jgi:hypothetical protein